MTFVDIALIVLGLGFVGLVTWGLACTYAGLAGGTRLTFALIVAALGLGVVGASFGLYGFIFHDGHKEVVESMIGEEGGHGLNAVAFYILLIGANLVLVAGALVMGLAARIARAAAAEA